MIDPYQTFDPVDPNQTPVMDEAAKVAAPPPRLAGQPDRIDRYRLDKVLGEGGFGTVYLAYDEQLNRAVAIKVPRRKRLRPEDAAAYLAEARVLASLDHPNIVPVYDIGTTPEGLSYVVSKLIEGSDLAKLISTSRPTQNQSAELVASIASALHYAHRKGLVHRDVKPANILIDSDGICYVADFGLALKDEDYGKGLTFAGTPAYMSPEQARSEGHRVNGQSDIFSLGIIFYELLVGRRPFRGDTLKELLDAIANADVRPPRQVNDGIAKELERICLKALAKRVSERYTTAKDMADDLRHYLTMASMNVPFVAGTPGSAAVGPLSASSSHATAMPLGASTQGLPNRHTQETLEIVPRGLRSFDVDDADTFLDLLPGARDRRGLPDSVGFWKTRLEERDPDCTFSVGLVYGPSGCGKTSLVKAGLLPRLEGSVIVVYLEATARETESRLLNGLRKRLPDLPADMNLKDTMSTLRQGLAIPTGKKVAIVVDQFEQWLHAHRGDEDGELVQALRQCDGANVQCLLMVRDDFWMAVTRFLGDMEIELIQGTNFAAVDLFDLRHAEKVLAAFGRAFGALPTNAADTTAEQKEFLTQAIAGLAQDGKVICVRLALFAEMMKGKPWTPATLKDVGGTSGIGVTFLEEAFASASANPRHRAHQAAARAVLGSLLPELGTNIKGAMRSRDDLMRVSGCGRAKDFDDLMRILDGELRLITPTDPEGKDEGGRRKDEKADATYYQLTHDYLVPSLREWLTSKQKETRRGRAELLLADQAGVWSVRPENRFLPSLGQWLRIRCLTRKKAWTAVQRQMMRKAARLHAVRLSAVAVLLVAATVAGIEIQKRVAERHAAGLVQRLLDAEIVQVPAIVGELAAYRRWTDPLLAAAKNDKDATPGQSLRASLALLPGDVGQKDYLYERLLAASPREVAVVRDSLAPHQGDVVAKLWTAAERPAKGQEGQRLRAAAALAAYDPTSPRWDAIATPLVEQLVRENPAFLGVWLDALRPVKDKLVRQLAASIQGTGQSESERMLATSILTDFAGDRLPLLVDALLNADEKQFAILLAPLQGQGPQALPLLKAELAIKVAEPRETFKKEGTIAADDAAVKISTGESRPAKAFDVPLQAGRLYRIAMSAKAPVDSYLVVQDKAGKQLAFDDDSGGKKNALLAFTPSRDDTYRVFAASYEKTGPFSLTITEVVADEAKEKLARRQANAALALLHLNDPDAVWQSMKHSPDPRLRSHLIHRLAPYGIRPDVVRKRLDVEQDVTARRALILALGVCGDKEFSSDDRAAVIKSVEKTYETSDDAGLRAAAEWTLRQWGQGDWLQQSNAAWTANKVGREKRFAGLYETLSNAKGKAAPQWYVSGQGQTMVVIPGPVTFMMGSPVTEGKRQPNEVAHKRRIGRTFAIAAKPVTVGEFRRFDKGYTFDESRAPEPDCPVIQTSWHHAGLYCNWLSEQEGIPPEQWCFEPAGDAKTILKLKPNYLSLTGYRLPTEAELEYAIRAGAATSRCYGEADDLLGRYAWFAGNSGDRAQPVGRKMPNDLGLFDVHGNVWCWCLEGVSNYPAGMGLKDAGFGDREFPDNTSKNRLLRGGSFDDQASYLRAAYRNSNAPAIRQDTYGFRVARTIAAAE